MSKPELEFFPASNIGWIPVAGNVSGLYERILAQDTKGGIATRRAISKVSSGFAPGMRGNLKRPLSGRSIGSASCSTRDTSCAACRS